MIDLSEIYSLVKKLIAAHSIDATLRSIENYDVKFSGDIILLNLKNHVGSGTYIGGFSYKNILVSLAGDVYNNVDEIEVWMADGKSINSLPEAELFSKDSIIRI